MSSKNNDKQPKFVLVVKEENLQQLDLYLDNLRVLGLDFESEIGQTVDLIFIKVNINDEALKYFSQLYEIGTEDLSVSSSFYREPVFETPFPNPIASNTPLQIGELTDADKITVVNKILQNVKYGHNDKEFGLAKLIELKIVETAYPLHDGPATETGTNVRSLLYRFWSASAMTHVQQPLDLIFQYFGNEVAFYFAWLEYFNIMLAVPAVLGSLTFLVSLAYLAFGDPVEVREVCTNDEVLCPMCEKTSGCKFPKISKYCSLAQWTYVFDNHFTIAFAVFISFWATLVFTLWRRKENKLKMRWNCMNDVRETDIRLAYQATATQHRVNRVSGEVEYYTPRLQAALDYTGTFLACAILFGIIVCVLLLNVVFKIVFVQICTASNYKYLQRNGKVLSMLLGSIIQICCMKLFEIFYKPASIYLTKLENPRTQFNFDNSVLYKRYMLAFMNNYIPVTYLAFMKGQFITLPHNMSFLRKDSCQPCNCVVALCMQLTFIMTVKTLLGNVFSAVLPPIKRFLRYLKSLFHGKIQPTVLIKPQIPQWEEEYYLEPVVRYSVTGEFSEMVIRYGFVAFFSKAFPLGAVCTLLNNLIELRSDAYKFVRSHRRPVPVEKSGIGAWNGVLRSLSYFGTAMNAFAIAFTSDWIPKEVYRLRRGQPGFEGHVNSSLSKYATIDNEAYDHIRNQSEFCYFRGHYYPPESTHRYETTQTYWMDLTFRFVTVFVFEHIVLMCNAVLAYCIPYEPESVCFQLAVNRQREKQVRLSECEKKLDKQLPKNLDISKSLQGVKH